jgi:hypothetical protein
MGSFTFYFCFADFGDEPTRFSFLLYLCFVSPKLNHDEPLPFYFCFANFGDEP